MAVCHQSSHQIELANWLQKHFGVPLEIKIGEVLANFAKRPLDTDPNLAHGSVEVLLLLREVGTTIRGKDVPRDTICRITIYNIWLSIWLVELLKF